MSHESAASPVLDGEHIIRAYARWAPIYDKLFGIFNIGACRAAAEVVNRLPPGRVLEVGVGTGIALPLYDKRHRLVGIDLSPDMLARAERRVRRRGLANVEGLHEMDASNLAFPEASFDAATGMFVITVVPETDRVLAEIARVVKPGGRVIFVSHFWARTGMVAAIESWLSRFSSSLGWNPGFTVDRVLGCPALRLIERRSVAPLGFHTLLVFERI